MNHTVIVDEAERDRRFENRLNAVVRHWRIRNVRQKLISGYGHIEVPEGFDPFKWPSVFSLPDMTPRKCSCKPGQACGNVACPHLQLVTSWVADEIWYGNNSPKTMQIEASEVFSSNCGFVKLRERHRVKAR